MIFRTSMAASASLWKGCVENPAAGAATGRVVERSLAERSLAESSVAMSLATQNLDLRNRTEAALLVAASALRRRESRGGHFRSDFPATDPAQAHRSFITLGEALLLAQSCGSDPESKRA